MDQVFNELSLSASLPDNHAAHAALLKLKKASDGLKAWDFLRNSALPKILPFVTSRRAARSATI